MFKKKMLNNSKLFFLLLIYTFINIFFYNNSYLKIFLIIIFLIFYNKDKIIINKKYLYLTLIISILLLIIYFLSGTYFGYIKSPYSHTFLNILKNLIKTILPIFFIEIMRYKLIINSTFFKRVLITFLIILSEINFKALFISHDLILFKYLISVIIPLIFTNILYTYLTNRFNYEIPIIIRLFTEIPMILLPVIPNYNWFISGSFSILRTAIIYYVFKYFILKERTINYPYNNFKIIELVIILLSLFLILFMLGIFKYQAVAILSNSMNPIFQRGDIVIYEKSSDIKPSDIIVYEDHGRLIVHRVVSINEDFYITKGDNNNTVDNTKVYKENIKGIYHFHLKYLGYPSIFLYDLLYKEG